MQNNLLLFALSAVLRMSKNFTTYHLIVFDTTILGYTDEFCLSTQQQKLKIFFLRSTHIELKHSMLLLFGSDIDKILYLYYLTAMSQRLTQWANPIRVERSSAGSKTCLRSSKHSIAATPPPPAVVGKYIFVSTELGLIVCAIAEHRQQITIQLKINTV